MPFEPHTFPRESLSSVSRTCYTGLIVISGRPQESHQISLRSFIDRGFVECNFRILRYNRQVVPCSPFIIRIHQVVRCFFALCFISCPSPPKIFSLLGSFHTPPVLNRTFIPFHI